MADWTVEDLRRARLPEPAWHALAASLIRHLEYRDPSHAELVLARVREWSATFARGGATPEFLEEIRLGLGILDLGRADRRRQKAPETPWLVLEVHVAAVEHALIAAAPTALEATMRRLWSELGGDGPLPPALVDEVAMKRRRPRSRALRFVAELRGVDEKTLRDEVGRIRRQRRSG